MAEAKDTIYIDIDDDITSIIDKATSARAKIVALVLPKRDTVLKSQVNMKLLKRATDDAGKHLVLITGESSLMPLAGAAGVYVARTLSSKPEVPGVPAIIDEVEDIDESEPLPVRDFNARESEDKPIGEIAAAGAQVDLSGLNMPDDDTIELDNSDEPATKAAAEVKKPKIGKDKKKKIPNFSRFRNYALLVILVLVGLGVLFYFALAVWPHGTVKIFTKQSSVPASFTASLSSDANKVVPSDEIIPAVAQTEQKSYSQTVPASGQKDEGERATGSVVFTICVPFGSFPDDIAKGTFISTNNLNFITQENAVFGVPTGNCSGGYEAQTDDIAIIAQKPGDNYNVSSATFQVSGSDATATGSADGGTTDLVRVVQQSDIDAAKAKLKNQDNSAIKQTLESDLKKGNLVPVLQTFAVLPSEDDISADAGEQANNVTVTENVTYVMYGYRASDLQQLIKANIADELGGNQGILNYGLDNATFKPNGTPTTNSASVSISTTVTIGPKLDKVDLIDEVAGKKAGDIRRQLERQSGVSKVEVDTSPFWVTHVPKDHNKITVEFVKSAGND